MYCPECGKEENQSVPFCRACGTDLHRVRVAVETPDNIAASATTAREEIGRPVAARIRETQDAYELKKVAEDVLPEIEKFLESPEEKRLRRMRLGMLIASIGMGAAIGLSLVAVFSREGRILVSRRVRFYYFFYWTRLCAEWRFSNRSEKPNDRWRQPASDRRPSRKYERSGTSPAVRPVLICDRTHDEAFGEGR
jgi:hypothetical protein